MIPLVLALSLFYPCHTLQQGPERARLIAERGAKYSFEDGVLELRGGGGWLRIPRVVTDFRLAFDFRVVAPDTEAGVVVRSWPGRGGWPQKGYRLALPAEELPDASALFVGREQKVDVVERGQIDLRPSPEWQHVEITGAGKRVTLALNGTPAAAFEIESFGGYILFDNRKGRVLLRNVTIVDTESASVLPDDQKTFEALTDAAGKNPKLISPKLIREVEPNYTVEAIGRQIQGFVMLEAVVLPDGSVGPIRIKRSLDRGLDQAAIAALKAWRFKPAILDGKAVPAIVLVQMDFKLK